MLDERFESYLEDVDFGIRCGLGGFKGHYVPEAVARHWGSATLGVWNKETVRRIARNQVYLVAKHYPMDWALRYGWAVLVGQLLWGLVAARHGRVSAFLRGKWEGMMSFESMREDSQGGIGELLERSEAAIWELQRGGRIDWYWRIYFALT